MAATPAPVAAFLSGKRIVVAGVSRGGNAPANAILRRLRACGYNVAAVNPHAAELEGLPAYADVASVPGAVDGVIVAVHPAVAASIVEDCARRGVTRLWFHRSFGEGSVSEAALVACRRHGIEPIVGGCPLMYLAPIDPVHRLFRWWLCRRGRGPG